MTADRATDIALSINTGSQSVRLASYRIEAGTVNRMKRLHYDESETAAIDPLSVLLNLPSPELVMHRWVYGGDWLTGPYQYRGEDAEELDKLVALAPLHNPKAHRWLQAAMDCWPDAQQILVPDTGLFRTMPEVAWRIPLPRGLCKNHGLRRYGFHGLAHAALWRELREHDPTRAAGRVITLQLGGGCSATALLNGHPQDTSMGYSPLSGLLMSTRPGDIDVGALLALLPHYSGENLATMLNQESGLRAVSGESGDMRTLLASREPEAAMAIEQFCYRIRQYVGAYAAVLGGLDALVFGGGIGLHAPVIREHIVQPLAWLGLRMDAGRNAGLGDNGGRISTPDSSVGLYALAGDEERELCEQGLALEGSQ
ncbi:acetate/propionate family kinase [Haliea atlantica]